MTGRYLSKRAVIAKAISLKQSSLLLTIILSLYYTNFTKKPYDDYI